MFTMKEICALTGLSYETLKFYCNEGLIPDVKRDKNNYRIFDDYNLNWIKSLQCLKNCEMSIAEMKEYLAMCLECEKTIPARKIMLEKKQAALRERIKNLQAAIDYIDWKQNLYDGILSGTIEYKSNLIRRKV